MTDAGWAEAQEKMKTTTVRVEDRSRMAPVKVLSVRLEDLLRVLDKAADHFVIPCQGMLALGKGGCPDCRGALELKSELLKMASILRAEASKGLKQSATKRGHHPAFDEYGEHR